MLFCIFEKFYVLHFWPSFWNSFNYGIWNFEMIFENFILPHYFYLIFYVLHSLLKIAFFKRFLRNIKLFFIRGENEFFILSKLHTIILDYKCDFERGRNCASHLYYFKFLLYISFSKYFLNYMLYIISIFEK